MFAAKTLTALTFTGFLALGGLPACIASSDDPMQPPPGQAIDPATGLPFTQPAQQFDPATGLPAPAAPAPIDPATGLPAPAAPAPIDPATDLPTPAAPAPIDPATGLPAPPAPGAPAPGVPAVATPGIPAAPVDPANPVPVDPATPVPADPIPADPANPVDPAPVGSPGWYTTGPFAGCVWTGVEGNADVGMYGQSTIAPRDFVDVADGGPYCVSGEVAQHGDWKAVALLGFDVASPPGADCSAKPLGETVGTRPTVEATGAGIAVNFVKQGDDTGFTWRVQVEGADGSSDEAQRWCANIQATSGKVFIPYGEFDTQCWHVNTDGTTGADYTGAKYDMEPISAVTFTVPSSDTVATPYQFCVNGFAEGSSENDAPDGSAVASAERGSIGVGNNYDRAKVTVDGETYVIQNNNWGENGDLVLDYSSNSFVIASGNGTGDSAPASFPSIFIGANGFTENGAKSTSSTDNLPIQISSIQSIPTRFRWSGSTNTFNATYDVWFASSPPNGRYNDGLNGFVMVWTHLPGNGKVPIGSDVDDVMIEGRMWDVWVGPRGQGPNSQDADITPDENAPVISYLTKNGDIPDYSFNLKAFIDDAVSRGGGASSFTNSLYLTDVFVGFEIWNGGAGGNLAVDEFTINVQ
jgi:hypothetical protein